MSTSKRELILQALEELWSGGPAGLTVHRNPARPIERDALPAIAVSMPPGREGESVARMDHDDGVERTMRVRAEIRAADTSVTRLNATVDEVFVWVLQQVALDRTLGGIAEDVIERAGTFDTGETDQTYQAVGVEFDVIYWTSEDDPSQEPA